MGINNNSLDEFISYVHGEYHSLYKLQLYSTTIGYEWTMTFGKNLIKH